MEKKAVRAALGVAVAATTLFAGRTSHADEREQCASAADQAQQLRDEGKYRRAREQLLVCARDVCPAPIKRDCNDWLTQLENVAPTVVLAAKDGTRDLADVKVTMDGVSVADHLDGKPIAVDLGEHTFKFEHGGVVKEEKVVIGAGQKSRNITVSFGAGAPVSGGSAPAGGETQGASGGSSMVPVLVAGAIGVVGIGSFAFFGISGLNSKSDLKSTCAPRCAQSDVDSIHTKFLIGDISLGIGVVALGVATYLYLAHPKLDADVKTGTARIPRTRLDDLRVDFAPLTGGGAASFAASF